jgi:hypothetical protein
LFALKGCDFGLQKKYASLAPAMIDLVLISVLSGFGNGSMGW